MATEFTVLLPDKPGSLADLTEALAKYAVSIVAIHTTSCPEYGITQFVTNNTDATVLALKEAGMDYTAQEVLLLTLTHDPGALARLARTMGQAGININSLYMAMTGQVIMDVNDLRKAQQIALAFRDS
jgi:hypothetical protein